MPYSAKIIGLNAKADPELLGVALGRLCIAQGIPALQVCIDLDVSKSVVYRWFSGRGSIGKHLRPKVEAYYRATLSRA